MQTALEYLFGEVGARIATVLMLVVGGVLVTGASISSIFRGFGRGVRGVVLGGRGVAETVIRSRDQRRREKTAGDLETRAAVTDVMSDYPDEDRFEPTVAMSGEDYAAEADHAGSEAEGQATTDFGEVAPGDEDPSGLAGREAEGAPVDGEAPPGDADHDLVPAAEDGAGEAADGGAGTAPALTPQGNKRGVTESEQISYRPPPAKALEKGRSDRAPTRATTTRWGASWSKPWAISGSRRRSSASSAALTCPATSCGSRRGPR